MLLAQVNRDTQGMEFQSVDGDPQQVTLCLTEAVTVADDNIDGMDTVSLQAVTLVDGSTAYIQHSPKGTGTTFLELLFRHTIFYSALEMLFDLHF